MHWLLLLILTAILLGLYNFFIKLSSGHIHEIAGAVILQVVAFLLGGLAMLWLKYKGAELEISPKGLLFSILAGLSVGLAEILAFYAFGRGVSASVGIPVMVGGTVLVGVILGTLVLQEQLTLAKGIGTLLVIAGIVFIARG